MWVSPILPYPTNAGNTRYARDVLSLIQSVHAEVDFVYFGNHPDFDEFNAELDQYFNRIVRVPVSSQTSSHPKTYWGVDDWCEESLVREVADLVAQKPYDAVYVDYIWLSRVFDVVPRGTTKILNTHDAFTNRNRIFESIGRNADWYYTTADQEAHGLGRADVVLAIVEHEREFFQSLFRSGASTGPLIRWFPPMLSNRKPNRPRSRPGSLSIGFLGTKNQVNQLSLYAFLRDLDRFSSGGPSIRVNVAGDISNMPEAFPNVDRIRVARKGFVWDPSAFYAANDLIAVPMIESTGLKIKFVEALEHGCPIVATQWGSRGLPVREPWHAVPSVEFLAYALTAVHETYSGLNTRRWLRHLGEETRVLRETYRRTAWRQQQTVRDEVERAIDHKTARHRA